MSATENRSPQVLHLLLRGSLLLLPYLSYVGLVGLVVVLFSLLVKFKRTALDPFTGYGLLWVAGLMLLSSVFAVNRSEAFLQLANYLPFFLLFSVLPFLLTSIDRLEQLAVDWVIAALPINAFALVEYILRGDFLPAPLGQLAIVQWVRNRPHAGRAMVMFDHPNALAGYLVLVLGIGLGLILHTTLCQKNSRQPSSEPAQRTESTKTGQLLWQFGKVKSNIPQGLLYLATYANLIGIFASGSRNGLVVAVTQLLVFGLVWGFLVRVNRKVLSLSLLGMVGILVSAAALGIGGRSLSLEQWANDPRFRLWQVSLSLFQERPWLGWGLGNYKFQFVDRLLSLYPSCYVFREYRVVPVECADVTHPHNFWLMLMVEGGVLVAIGLTVWVGFICFRAVKRLITQQLQTPDSALLLGYCCAFAGCVAFACFDVTLYDSRVNTLSWTILAAIYCYSDPTAQFFLRYSGKDIVASDRR